MCTWSAFLSGLLSIPLLLNHHLESGHGADHRLAPRCTDRMHYAHPRRTHTLWLTVFSYTPMPTSFLHSPLIGCLCPPRASGAFKNGPDNATQMTLRFSIGSLSIGEKIRWVLLRPYTLQLRWLNHFSSLSHFVTIERR